MDKSVVICVSVENCYWDGVCNMFMFHYHQICRTYVCVSLLPKHCNVYVFLYHLIERKREDWLIDWFIYLFEVINYFSQSFLEIYMKFG